MFSKLLDKISSNKRIILWGIVGFLLFFVLSDSVFAAEVANNSTFEKARQTAASAAEWIGTILTVFLSVLTYLSTVFLSPEWINGSLFGLNGYFKSIWILISNVVYLIFAFIIIWIAFMNIIGKGQEKYALKQALPKFVVGVLIVPFSWFLVQFILSISAVLTISALNLPFETFKTFDNKLSEVEIPANCTLNLKSEDPNKTGTSGKEETKKFFDCGGTDGEKISLSKLRQSKDGIDSIFGVIGIYTYGILSIESMDKLNASEINKITNMLDLIVKLVFDVLFIVIYSILMIALGLVLMVRGIYIWIYIMISPLFGLMYFFDKTSGGGEFFDKFNLKQFISLAMVPVYTMLALSFGILFIYAAGHGMSYNSPYKDVSSVILSKPETKTGDQNLKIGQFSLAIKGSPANAKNITGFFDKVADGGLGVIGTLIMKIFGVVVLWGAVMAALRSNEMTKAIIEPLHAFGGQVGGLITKAPQYAPIFGGQSMQSMSQIGSSASNYYTNTLPGNSASDFMQKHGLFGNDKTSVDSTEIRNALNRNMNDVGPAIKKALINAGEANIASNREELITSLLEVAKRLDPNGAYKDTKISDIKGNAESFVKLNQYIDEKLTTSGAKNADIFGDGGPTVMNGNTSQYNNWLRKENDLKKSGNNSQTSGINGNQTITLNINGKSVDFTNKLDSSTVNGVSNYTGISDNNATLIATSIGKFSGEEKDLINQIKTKIKFEYPNIIDPILTNIATKIASEVKKIK